MNLRSIQAVARKEYYHLIRDFRSLYLALIIPLLLILLFGYALSLDVEHIPLVVVEMTAMAGPTMGAAPATEQKWWPNRMCRLQATKSTPSGVRCAGVGSSESVSKTRRSIQRA